MINGKAPSLQTDTNKSFVVQNVVYYEVDIPTHFEKLCQSDALEELVGCFNIINITGDVVNITGYTASEFKNDPNLWWTRIRQDQMPVVLNALKNLVSNQVSSLEIFFQDINGDEIPMRWESKYLKKERKIVGFWRDLRQEIAHHQTLDEKIKLEQEQFLHRKILEMQKIDLQNHIDESLHLAHEIRNAAEPLREVLKGIQESRALLTGDSSLIDTDLIVAHLKSVEQLLADNMDRITDYSTDWMDMFKFKEGKMKYRPYDYSFKEFLENLARTTNSINHSQLSISLELIGFNQDPKVYRCHFTDLGLLKNFKDIFLFSDQKILYEILFNLIKNAYQHTHSWVRKSNKLGNIILRIENIYNQSPSTSYKMHFSVIDNGEGIKKNILPTLAQKFSQGDSSQMLDQNKTGIGLQNVRSRLSLFSSELVIMSRHHSECGSDQISGSTFSFTVTVPKGKNAQARSEATLSEMKKKWGDTFSLRDRIVVYVVDDSPSIIASLKKRLERINNNFNNKITIKTFESANEAFESYKNFVLDPNNFPENSYLTPRNYTLPIFLVDYNIGEVKSLLISDPDDSSSETDSEVLSKLKRFPDTMGNQLVKSIRLLEKENKKSRSPIFFVTAEEDLPEHRRRRVEGVFKKADKESLNDITLLEAIGKSILDTEKPYQRLFTPYEEQLQTTSDSFIGNDAFQCLAFNYSKQSINNKTNTPETFSSSTAPYSNSDREPTTSNVFHKTQKLTHKRN
ncbi:MAG: sensor histidine kinase [Flavobacteriales bacterium]|nr:sensor histidine kinase [Flavobacteriales bacterium]